VKVVILAGGRGTRLAEETETKPKPMVEIGGHPILWHIMKLYAAQGFSEFVVALGYKGDLIKHYFLDYAQVTSDFILNLKTGNVERLGASGDDWNIHFVDTGLDTQTGGRISRLRHILKDEPFMLTYGDGVSDVDLKALIAFHKRSSARATITAVRPPARFGGLVLNGVLVSEFTEKPQVGEGWINGGFAVLEPDALSYLNDDSGALEVQLFEALAKKRELAAFPHEGFWQCMDTLREKQLLEQLWASDSPPWRIWQ
jgi:glucose-1-phosphate cytidylyltransferase